MSIRPKVSEELSARQRLCLFHGTSVSAEEAMTTPEADITADFLKQKCVTVVGLTAAGLGPLALKKMGMPTASALRELGFDALHLADARFAAEAAAAFGSSAVVASFVSDASDAVAVAGSEAADILGITCADLLQCCAGAPTEAHAVLQQLEQGSALACVPVKILLDTGIRSAALADVGYTRTAVERQTGASKFELGKLGF